MVSAIDSNSLVILLLFSSHHKLAIFRFIVFPQCVKTRSVVCCVKLLLYCSYTVNLQEIHFINQLKLPSTNHRLHNIVFLL